MNDAVHVSDHLVAFLDGELPPEACSRVAAHLLACSACAAERDSLRAALEKVSAARGIEPSPALRAKVLAAVDLEPRQGWLRSLLSPRFLVPAFAGLGAAAVLVVTWQSEKVRPGMEDLPIAEHLELLEDWDVANAVPPEVDARDLEAVALLHELPE